MVAWFEEYPEILASELGALAAAGFEVTIGEDAQEKGILQLNIIVPRETGNITLEATYPEFYPYFKPYVTTRDLELDRHQNPLTGEICLLGRSTSNWHSDSTLADIIQSQLPPLLDYNDTGALGDLLLLEERQGEPYTAYFNGAATHRSYLLIDSAWEIPIEVTEGTFSIRYRSVPSGSPGNPAIQGWVEAIRGPDGRALARWQGPRPPGYEGGLSGKWLRRDKPPSGDLLTLGALFASTEEMERFAGRDSWPRGRHVAISALIIPEEVQQQISTDGWLLLRWDIAPERKGQSRSYSGTVIRTARAGETDLAARMPATATLRESVVAVVGVGAVGSPIAMELARAGIKELRLIDPDYLEPSTVRRWESGWSGFGESKISALAEMIKREYPWTKVVEFPIQLGSITSPEEPDLQRIKFEEAVSGVSLIMDAAAELGVTHFLTDFARQRALPIVIANATPGGWGGMVANFVPRDGACWMCMRHAVYGENGDNGIALPSADEHEGLIQPAGCSDVSFTGASFDLREISLEAVRTVVGLLGGDGGYPSPTWNLAVVSMRDKDNRRILPHWEGHQIKKRPECSCST